MHKSLYREISFNNVKNALEIINFESYLDYTKHFILQVDNSGEGLDYILIQERWNFFASYI